MKQKVLAMAGQILLCINSRIHKVLGGVDTWQKCCQEIGYSKSGKNRNCISVRIFTGRANKSQNLFQYKEVPK